MSGHSKNHGYRERRQKRITIAAAACVLVVLIIFAFGLFGQSGILTNLGVHGEYRALKAERDRLELENARYLEEIRALKDNQRKIEEVSRTEYGFARPGEIVFYFPEDQGKPVQVSPTPVQVE